MPQCGAATSFCAGSRRPIPNLPLPSHSCLAVQCATRVTGPSLPIVSRIGSGGATAGEQYKENNMFRGFMLGAATAVALSASMPAHAVTELQWWHAMTGGNNDVIVKLAND